MLHITLLGEQAVVDAATGEVRTRASRTIALLAHLVAHAGSPQSRTRIAGLFWPESRDGQALTNLRRELHQLRRVLGPEATPLEVTSTHLCWRPAPCCEVDLTDFQAARRAAAADLAAGRDAAAVEHGLLAIERYGGDLLPGMDEDWVLDLRSELARDCVATCDLVCEAATRAGRPEAALGAARRRITVAPLEEVGYRTLMEIQAGMGDRADAITTYHRCATVLEQELGVEPDPATTRTLHRLLGQQSPTGPVTPETTRARPRRPDLVGRSAEMAELLKAWAAATSGRSGVVLVHGAAGVGKSRLVAELAARARADGAVVAVGRCFEASGRLSLAPVAEWMRSPAVASARSSLDAVWRDEVERLVPVHARTVSDAPARPDRLDVWQRHRFFEGLARAVLAVSRPTLLVLEDVQWCDEDTLAFCSVLMNLARRARVLLAVTLRANDASQAHAEPWVAAMRDAGRLRSLRVDPFDLAGTADLAEVLCGSRLPEGSARSLHEATGGFPLYVVEASRSAGDLPAALARSDATMSEILLKRLERVSPAARAVAGLAAAVGQDFDLTLLTEASDLDADTVVLAVDELWQQRIVREHVDGYLFTHDRLSAAAYELVSRPRRWLLHRRIAQALELVNAGHTDHVAAQIAAQYRAAGNRGRAVVHYRQAARAASAVFAHAQAVEHHRAILALLRDLPPTRDRDEQELESLRAMIPPLNALQGYSSPELEQTLERAVALTETLGLAEERVTAMVGLWACRFVQGRMRPAYDLARHVLALVAEQDARLGQAHFSLAGSALHLGRPGLAAEHFEVALSSISEESLSVGTRARVHTAAWAAHAAWALGEPDTAARLADSAVQEARATGHRYSLTVALAYAAITRQLLGQRDEVNQTAAELRELCDRCAFAYYGEWGRVLGGWSLGGRAGVDLARTGLENLRRQGAHARRPYWLGLLAETVEDPAERCALLDDALAAAGRQEELWWVPELMRQRARFDPDGGHARLSEALTLARSQDSTALLTRCANDLAAAAGALGER